MKNKTPKGIHQKLHVPSLLAVSLLTLSVGCNKPPVNPRDLKDFKQINLVANKAIYAPKTTDPTLINGFGIAWSPTGIAWVNSVGGHVSELYTAEGAIARTPVNIPSPKDATGGLPCGIVFNDSKGFVLSNGNPAAFIFTGFDGVLSAWNGAAGNNAIPISRPLSAKTSYTGLAIATNNGKTFIYGANFGESKIDVWNAEFGGVKMSFIDPALPKDYSPYNVQAVGDWLFVIYAKLGSDGHAVPGQGTGFVSVFNKDGSFVKRFASRGTLNIPWGVVMAPASFLEDKDMGNDDHGNNKTGSDDKKGGHESKEPVILVGNFGDGRINVYTLEGKFLGQLQSHKQSIVIDGLWALSFAPATSTVDQSRLYFSAGPEKESDGIFGYLIKQ
jgi:uncharacterized protein (TIGR03118 family)